MPTTHAWSDLPFLEDINGREKRLPQIFGMVTIWERSIFVEQVLSEEHRKLKNIHHTDTP